MRIRIDYQNIGSELQMAASYRPGSSMGPLARSDLAEMYGLPTREID